ncbi:ATP-binding protein [Phenylobacterium sp.]|uniref:ATP-binding protein n=1 Tax=Phenylobacterium sp. TaxID=1871053 RepID=UPI002FC7375B
MADMLRGGPPPTADGSPPGELEAVGNIFALLRTLAFAAAITLGLSQSPHLGNLVTAFLAMTLIVAVVFGLTSGLVAAVAGLAVLHLLRGLEFPPTGLGSDDGFLLALFGASVVTTGVYSDVVRRRNRYARSLLEAGRPLSPHASGPALGDFFRIAKHKGLNTGRLSAADEAQRAFAAFCVVGLGLVGSLVAGYLLGPFAAMLSVLVAVVIVGGGFGARFGLAAGIFAMLILNGLPGGPDHTPMLKPLEAGFSMVMFAALGWSVGVLADRLQQEQGALETVVTAGRDLSASADEGAIRQVLFDSLVRIAPRGGVVQIRDEAGTINHSTPGAEVLSSGQRPDSAEGWNVKRLAADGRDVGVVVWRIPGAAAAVRAANEIVVSLIDLGASAIVRSRLSLEKADVEFVARTEQLRTILLDAVSHHFRSPLAGIMGSVTSILNLPEQHDRGVRRELLLIIKEQANRLDRYVDNFLSVARLESGSIDVNLADISLEPLIYDVWETFGEAGGARRFLHVKVDSDLVRADSSLLAQVFGNVLENAIKFSPEGSVVDVRSRKDGSRLVVEVSDQGPGVEQEYQDRIFDRFFRSRRAKAPGLGLGLYITRSLVEIMGGSVQARNRSNGETGLVMSIALPLAEAPQ